MAACPRCGERNPEAARFCAACGSSLPPPPAVPLETRKTVTVLFCDVTGSTALGERQDPEQVRRVLSRYYEVSRDILQRHGGTVEKFMGDAVMAVFGAPVLHEDDALRALRAAAELRDAIAVLNEDLDAVYGVQIAVRIGVNSGEVIAGDTIRGHSFAAGDAVNVAQRLESVADAGEILFGDATHRLARDAIRSEQLGPLTLRGKEEQVEAHRLLEVLPGVLSHTRRFDSPMVGRDRELQSLADAFERAAAERSCHIFTVLGDAGVGKSRLVRESLSQIGDQARVLVGTCLPYGEGITFWPALEVVKQGTGIVDGDSPADALAKIRRTLGDEASATLAAERVAALVGLEETGDTAEQGFWGFRKLVEALARERPTVVVFDDVNWGEPHFLDLIEHLAESVRAVPLIVVCMARPDLLELRPSWGGGKRNATSIFLEPLSEDESRELLANLVEVEIGEDVIARIQRRAEGNPLFVEEMVSMLIDGGYLGEDGEDRGLAEIPVPASIQVLLASRLDQLSVGERRAIERAAVEGNVFHSGAVEALSDDDEHERVGDCFDALVRKELIVPYEASFAGVDGFRFRHVLIRDAAYEAVPKQIRADLHERCAAWLEKVAGDRLPELEEVVGYHLEQAYRSRIEVLRPDDDALALAARAGVRLGAAGRRALARGDVPAAVNLLDRAASILSDEARLEYQLELGIALGDAGELVRAERVLSEALDQAARRGDRRLELATTIERAALLVLSDPSGTDQLLGQVEAAIPVLERVADDRSLARAWWLLGRRQGLWKGQFARGEEALGRALTYALRTGDQRQEAEILGLLGFSALFGPTPVESAIDRCREMLGRDRANRLVEPALYLHLARLEARRASFDAARAYAERSRVLREELGMRLAAQAGTAMAFGDIELLAGDYAAAERSLRVGLEALGAMGEQGFRSTVAAYIARALYGQGLLDEADDLARRAEESSAADDIWSKTWAGGTRAKVLARRGDDREAERMARDAAARIEGTDALDLRGGAQLDLADVLVLAGRKDEARASAEAALGLFERKGNLVSAEEARSVLARAEDLGSVRVSEGRAGPAS
jgi:class 3 adenylate cyclase/tetratricopeptide (TPR) repeat protein